MKNTEPWLDAFRTRIFSPIQSDQVARLMNADQAGLGVLNIGTQFALRENNHWIHFWIPGMD
jgi:hypothetical protein